MEDFKKQITVNEVKDTQKLIHTYMGILNLPNNTPFDYIIKEFKNNFDFDVTREDLLLYFEPTLEEFSKDLELQLKNLNLH